MLWKINIIKPNEDVWCVYLIDLLDYFPPCVACSVYSRIWCTTLLPCSSTSRRLCWKLRRRPEHESSTRTTQRVSSDPALTSSPSWISDSTVLTWWLRWVTLSFCTYEYTIITNILHYYKYLRCVHVLSSLFKHLLIININIIIACIHNHSVSVL